MLEGVQELRDLAVELRVAAFNLDGCASENGDMTSLIEIRGRWVEAAAISEALELIPHAEPGDLQTVIVEGGV